MLDIIIYSPISPIGSLSGHLNSPHLDPAVIYPDFLQAKMAFRPIFCLDCLWALVLIIRGSITSWRNWARIKMSIYKGLVAKDVPQQVLH